MSDYRDSAEQEWRKLVEKHNSSKFARRVRENVPAARGSKAKYQYGVLTKKTESIIKNYLKSLGIEFIAVLQYHPQMRYNVATRIPGRKRMSEIYMRTFAYVFWKGEFTWIAIEFYNNADEIAYITKHRNGVNLVTVCKTMCEMWMPKMLVLYPDALFNSTMPHTDNTNLEILTDKCYA